MTTKKLTDVDRARALLDERDGEMRATIRGDVAALALAFRAIRREASRAPPPARGGTPTDPLESLAYYDEQTIRNLMAGRPELVSCHDAERLAQAVRALAAARGGTGDRDEQREAIASELDRLAKATPLGARFDGGPLHQASVHNFYAHAARVVRALSPSPPPTEPESDDVLVLGSDECAECGHHSHAAPRPAGLRQVPRRVGEGRLSRLARPNHPEAAPGDDHQRRNEGVNMTTPTFPDAKFYACNDPETLTHTAPLESIEEYLDADLNPRMTVAEVVASIRERPITVRAYNPMEISDKQIEIWADELLESLGEKFCDEHGNPEDGPCDGFPDDAEQVMREAVKSIVRRSHVWGCEEVGKVTLTPDQIEEVMRAHRPDWFREPASPLPTTSDETKEE